MRKNYVVIGLLAFVTGIAFAAGTTKLTNLLVTGTFGVTGATTHTGAVTNSSTVTMSASTPYSIIFSSKTAAIPTGTPSVAGILAFDSNWVEYISTGSTPGAWVKVGGQ